MVTKKPKSKIEVLREELSRLRKKREEIILEKGLLAQDNKDLRENFSYMLYEQKEHAITSQIRELSQEILDLSRIS